MESDSNETAVDESVTGGNVIGSQLSESFDYNLHRVLNPSVDLPRREREEHLYAPKFRGPVT